MGVVVLIAIVWVFFFLGNDKESDRKEEDGRVVQESQEVTFFASDGYKLSGTLWFAGEKAPQPLIITVHQFGSDRSDFEDFIPVLLNEGYAVFAYDSRGFGESKNGKTDINDFPKDVAGAIEFLQNERRIDQERIGVIGASVGANVAFVVSGSNNAVKAAVSLSPSNTGVRGMLLGNEIEGFSPKNIFIASDEREKADADFLYSRAGNAKEQKVYLGFGHGVGLLQSIDAQRDIISFFNRVLGVESRILLKNQGGSMEEHTPRGFKGMGIGLFAGDNLNPNFPDGDGVQLFITFDIVEIAEKDITSALLRSEHAHSSGLPFDLGVLNVEEVRYDSFSSALWNLEPEEGFACAFADTPEGSYECNVTEAVRHSIRDGYDYAQFRILFDEAGNEDGKQDLLMFYITDSNTNEPGIFELVIE